MADKPQENQEKNAVGFSVYETVGIGYYNPLALQPLVVTPIELTLNFLPIYLTDPDTILVIKGLPHDDLDPRS